MGATADGLQQERSIRIRTCIATRQRKPDTHLLRVVVDPACPGRLRADPHRCLPGRGAWITPTLDALELAEQRRAFARAFRVSTAVDTSHVRTFLVNGGERRTPRLDDRTLMSTQR